MVPTPCRITILEGNLAQARKSLFFRFTACFSQLVGKLLYPGKRNLIFPAGVTGNRKLVGTF
jgi:hypothetical protein